MYRKRREAQFRHCFFSYFFRKISINARLDGVVSDGGGLLWTTEKLREVLWTPSQQVLPLTQGVHAGLRDHLQTAIRNHPPSRLEQTAQCGQTFRSYALL